VTIPRWAVVTLLGTWCALTILPAMIVTLVFHFQTTTPLSSGTGLTFLAGYLLEVVAFLALSRTGGDAGLVGWLIAALLPWLAVGTATQTTLALLPCALVAVGYSLWYYRGFTRREDLKVHGIAARGVVLAVREPLMNQVINNIYIKRTLRLRIERSDHVAPYEVKFRGTFMLGQIPAAGDVLRLLVDPKDPRHFMTADRRRPT
jgi:hypothetical protein